MNNKDTRIILEEKYKDFIFQKNKSNLNISFNRIAKITLKKAVAGIIIVSIIGLGVFLLIRKKK